MITPRATRLVRVAGLQAFREAASALACAGDPVSARDRLMVVPTRAAAALLVRSLEDDALPARGALLLPDMVTSEELVGVLASRLPGVGRLLSGAEREVLLALSCRAAKDGGAEPPFRLRPGLIAEALRFYDALKRNQKEIDTFERLTLDALEPGETADRGAERLARQTRFLVAAYRDFERRVAEAGADEHALRRRLLAEPAPRPYRDVVVTVADRGFDAYGLWPADWDLLARIPGVEQVTLVTTDTLLAGALHERIHAVLPGIEETRFTPPPRTPPVLLVPGGPSAEGRPERLHAARDREEEVALFARRVKRLARADAAAPLDRHALVVRRPLPYVYVARDVLRAAGVPCQTFDALPLAAEPYAAAADLVFALVTGNVARVPAIALLRSPHFRFETDEARGVTAADVAALDRALSETGYLGEIAALDRLIAAWRASPGTRRRGALRAAERLRDLAGALEPLRTPAPVAAHLTVVLDFLTRHEHLPGPDDPLRARQLRARAAVLGLLAALRDAHARFDPAPVEFDHVVALVRRGIEAHTFAPRAGESGVHLVDAESARFGAFDHVQLAGLVDGEWPEPSRASIFYSASMLRNLGWPSEADRQAGAAAGFEDLLRLPASRLAVSTFLLESDAPVVPSPLADRLESAGLETVDEPPFDGRVFEHEALTAEPPILDHLPPSVRAAAQRRVTAPAYDAPRFHGAAPGHAPPAHSLTALERYQDCPFKYFAADVLRLQDTPEDGVGLSPRDRGKFLHEVFEQFFRAWDARGRGTIAPEHVDEARALFAEVAEPLLARLPDSDAALERTRLFGSAISVGTADVVLGLEASRPVGVEERWLEHRFEGAFSLAGSDGRRVSLTGVVDRVDLLEGRRLRVIDYKSGSAPKPRRALQVPIYALCAQEQLQEAGRGPWTIDEAAYVAFSGKRPLASVIKPGGSGAEDVLTAARERLLSLVDGIGRGEFPPRPHEDIICTWCAYPSVCRKDYVGDE